MKTQKLIVMAVTICLLAFFNSGSVAAQVTGPYGLFQEFCEDLRDASSEAEEELSIAAKKLKDCYDDFIRCKTGPGFNIGQQTCLGDFFKCQEESYQDVYQACSLFSSSIQEVLEGAEQLADDEGATFLFRFRRLVNRPTERSGLCIAPVLGIIEVCSGVDQPDWW